MNQFMREALLGGWHLLKQEPTPRPKEVVREKPVWVVPIGAVAAHSDLQCVAFKVLCEQIKAAAQEPRSGEHPTAAGVPSGRGAAPVVPPPAAAAPIDEFRVGDVCLWRGHLVAIDGGPCYGYVEGHFHGESAKHFTYGRGTFDLQKLELLGRPGPDGWIPHVPGDPCPVPAGVHVEVRFRCGREDCEADETPDAANTWFFEGCESGPEFDVVGWRLA